MSENWKKKERFYGLQWGMSDYTQTEQFRPGMISASLPVSCC
jgi:hypothetical protein